MSNFQQRADAASERAVSYFRSSDFSSVSSSGLVSALEPVLEPTETPPAALELALRQALDALLYGDDGVLTDAQLTVTIIEVVLDAAHALAERGLLTQESPASLLADVAQECPLALLEAVVDLLNLRKAEWRRRCCGRAGARETKAYLFLLRACIGLQRRLSAALSPQPLGKLLMFLANCSELEARSGLNLKGDVNTNTAVQVPGDDEDDDNGGPLGEEIAAEPLPSSFGTRFWGFQQDVLKSGGGRTLRRDERAVLEEVLTELERRPARVAAERASGGAVSRYLSVRALLPLQMVDGRFRRLLLTQLLTVLGDKDKKTYERVRSLLRDTEPGGQEYERRLKQVIHMEKGFAEWKRKKAPSNVRPAAPLDDDEVGDGSDKLSAVLGRAAGDLGDPELTRLWAMQEGNGGDEGWEGDLLSSERAKVEARAVLTERLELLTEFDDVDLLASNNALFRLRLLRALLGHKASGPEESDKVSPPLLSRLGWERDGAAVVKALSGQEAWPERDELRSYEAPPPEETTLIGIDSVDADVAAAVAVEENMDEEMEEGEEEDGEEGENDEEEEEEEDDDGEEEAAPVAKRARRSSNNNKSGRKRGSQTGENGAGDEDALLVDMMESVSRAGEKADEEKTSASAPTPAATTKKSGGGRRSRGKKSSSPTPSKSSEGDEGAKAASNTSKGGGGGGRKRKRR